MVRFQYSLKLRQHFSSPPPHLFLKNKCLTFFHTGIGKAYAKKLASQGLNVVLVALDDALLEETFTELHASYPNVTFRKVGVNLGQPGYLEKVKVATEDIDVQCAFLNAGYMITGMFVSVPIERHMENMECNATSAVQITHMLLQRMVRSVCFLLQ